MATPRFRGFSRLSTMAAVATGVLTLAVSVAPAEAKKCRKDAVQVGDACVDKYEASVWESTDQGIIKKIKKGKITSAASLTAVATQRGAGIDDYETSTTCPDNGNGCMDLYAVSIPGVLPATFNTWFQAAATCRNAGKRLASNQEWQLAALGTPDTGGVDDDTTTCRTDAGSPVTTGSRAACISDLGAFDMVGNVNERVAEWGPLSTGCPGWGAFSDDFMCVGGASTTDGPGAVLRGGAFDDRQEAGPFYYYLLAKPTTAADFIGFRCARDL